MNICDAMIKAADHIAANPESFDFNSMKIPVCGTPGCALGWIVAFSEPDIFPQDLEYSSFDEVAQIAGFSSEGNFYDEMDRVLSDDGADDWINSASLCALGLRRLAAEKSEMSA